jgi:hypothetical protein
MAGEDDDDDVVEIADPRPPPQAVFEMIGSQIEICGVKAVETYPHARNQCPTHAFGTPGFCATCYCAACEVKASECLKWSEHYTATARIPPRRPLLPLRAAAPASRGTAERRDAPPPASRTAERGDAAGDAAARRSQARPSAQITVATPSVSQSLATGTAPPASAAVPDRWRELRSSDEFEADVNCMSDYVVGTDGVRVLNPSKYCPFCNDLMAGTTTLKMTCADLDNEKGEGHTSVDEHAECKCRFHRRCRTAWMNGDRALEALCPRRTRKDGHSQWQPTCPLASHSL